MKRLALYALCLLLPVGYSSANVPTQTIVHVADGDCAGLQQALNLDGQIPNGNETGPKGELVVLAKNGSYPNCFQGPGVINYGTGFTLSGAITIDGQGATIVLGFDPDIGSTQDHSSGTGVDFVLNGLVTSGSPITFRHVNFVLNPGFQSLGGGLAMPRFPGVAWANTGDLILESSSISLGPNCLQISGFSCMAKALLNAGHIVLRNVTVTNAPTTLNLPGHQYLFIDNSGIYGNPNLGSVSVEQSTLSLQGQTAFYAGNVTTSDSILMSNGRKLCNFANVGDTGVSNGGNILSDNSCGATSSDHIVTDAGVADFGNHGGAVNTLALQHNSPAIGTGLAANCAATDARGVTRGSANCDAGAYEFGGGYGKLSASGISGVYYDAAHDGHYVTVQSLDGGQALVIWNTFNRAGKQAWVYGVGSVSDTTIHVGNVSQNLGGILQPGGTVTGSVETAWGSMDFAVANCYSATLKYESTSPLFGSGTVNLTRAAFLNGLDCSQ